MAEVVRDILLCLFLAALFGAAIGWFARGLRAGRRGAREAGELRRALEDVRMQLRNAQEAHDEQQHRLTGFEATADSALRDAAGLRKELEEVRTAKDAAGMEAARAREELRKLSSQLNAAEASSQAARGELDAAKAARSDAEARLVEVVIARDAGRRELELVKAAQPSPSAGEATRQRLETLKATLQAAEAGWDAARAQAETASQELRACQRALAESEEDRQALASRLVDAQSLLLELRSKLDAQPEIALAAAPPEPERSASPTSQQEHLHDDLQKIRGIGPVLEQTLHEVGIYRYAQIAGWTRDDVKAMSERLPGFRNRIVRDRWTAAARRLHIAKYGSPP